MNNNYEHNTVEKLVLDECFQDLVISPTSEKKEYWADKIAVGEISQEVYDEAHFFLKNIHSTTQLEVKDEQIEHLWKKISASNQKSVKRKRIYLISAVASVACVLLISLFVLKNFPHESDSRMSLLANQNIEELKRNDQIQLLLPSEQINIAEDEVVVDYSQDGKIKIDQDEIEADTIGYNQLIVPYGKRMSLILEDGSKLWVNAGSHLIYPSKFKKHKREIFVNGEVFADITSDAKRPFFVKSKTMDVKVLGTKFNFSSYEVEENQSVVLVSGSVEVSSIEDKKKCILKPNQEFYLSNSTPIIRDVNVTDFISWTRGYYTFKHRRIGEIAQYLTKYYGVSVSCSDEVKDLQFSGGIDLKDDINRVLQSLKLAAQIDYLKKENSYQIFKE